MKLSRIKRRKGAILSAMFSRRQWFGLAAGLLSTRQFSFAQSSAALPNLTIGTLGHVGHGKTTLTAAITRVLSRNDGSVKFLSYDSLNQPPAVKVGSVQVSKVQVEYQTPRRRYTQIDCQGNTDYIKDMIIGARQMDGAILVVAATDGPMPQTREHLLLAKQVGVPSIVVFLNKCDAIKDLELLDLVELEVRDLLNTYGFPADRVPVIRGSAAGGLLEDGVWAPKIVELMNAVDRAVPLPVPAEEKPFLMPIEDRFLIAGGGVAATGKIDRGTVKVGEEIEVVGFGKGFRTVVTGVESTRAQTEVRPGENVGLLLRGVTTNDLERGQVIAKPSSISAQMKFKAKVYMLTREEGGRTTPFLSGYRPQFYFRNTDVTGSGTLFDGTQMVMPGDNVVLDVELISPVAIEKGLRFALREGGRSVGVGVVTEVR
jgi:elongation factor Tu